MLYTTSMFNRRILAACAWLFGIISPSGCSHVRQTAQPYTENPGTEGNGNYTIGPAYKIDPDLTDRGNPKGKQFEFTMRLADSKIFRGDDSTLEPEKKPVRKERKIFVYVPAAYQDGTKSPILVIHDGPGQLKLVRNALDNLTISKDRNRKLPAFIAICGLKTAGTMARTASAGSNTIRCPTGSPGSIHGEVLPAVLNNAEIKAAYPKLALTDNPWAEPSWAAVRAARLH